VLAIATHIFYNSKAMKQTKNNYWYFFTLLK